MKQIGMMVQATRPKVKIVETSFKGNVGLLAAYLIDRILLPFGGRGYGRVWKYLACLIPRAQIVCSVVDGHRFTFDASDHYWNRLAVPGYIYEGEIFYLLSALSKKEYLFIDGGANFGYWSSLTSSKAFGGQVSVAVEADRKNFVTLQKNRAINADAFDVRLLGLHSNSGKKLQVQQTGHHSETQFGEVVGLVEEASAIDSISVDELVEQAGQEALPCVIKLDVEGLEIAVLQGCTRTLKRDCLLIYEDHGNDPRHQVTRYVLANLDLCVFFIDEKRCIFQIEDGDDLDVLKVNRKKGYNLFACSASSTFAEIFYR